MRARLCVAWLVGALLVVGCETNQPILQDQQVISLSFSAVNARVQAIDTWHMWEDSDGNGVPDDVDADGDPDVFLWCTPTTDFIGSQMPWSFSVQVDKVPAGGTENITIARETEPNRSFAAYDTGNGSDNLDSKDPLLVTNRTGYCSFDRDIVCNPDNPMTTICSDNLAGTCEASGVCSIDSSVNCAPDDATDLTCQSMGLGQCNNVPLTRRFVFADDRAGLSGANRKTLSAPPNILAVTDPVAALQRGPTAGICPGMDLGDSNVGGNSAPWTFLVNKGETVIVQARRFEILPEGFLLWTAGGDPPISATSVYVQIVADPIVAQTTIDGGVAGLTGSTATTQGDPESFIDFFFTSK